MVRSIRRISVAVILVLSLFPVCVIGAFKRTVVHDEDPSWRLDLRQFGFVERTDRSRFVANARISFLGEDALIVSFWTESTPGGCAWKKKAPPDRCRLHAVVIGAGTGKARSAHEWLFPFSNAVVYPARQGKFILLAGNELHLYSSDFQELRKVVLPSDVPGPAPVRVDVSPSGKTLLATWFSKKSPLKLGSIKPTAKSRHREAYQATMGLFETEGLKEVQALQALEFEGLSVDSISDNLVAARSFARTQFLKAQFLVRRVEQQQWQELHYGAKPSLFNSVKLLNDRLLVVQERNRVALLNTEGDRLFEDTDFRRSECLTWYTATSADGLRFAVGVSAHSSLRQRFWGPTVAIIVYDSAQRRRIFALALGSATQTRSVQTFHNFALSPDGSLLGYSADGVVELYRLPPSTPAGHTP